MNCGLLSDNHKHSPYQRIHIVALHFVFWIAFELSSQIRVDILKVCNVSSRYAEIVQSIRVVSSLMSKFLGVSFLLRSGKFWSWFVSVTASFLARSLILASVSHTWELDATSFWFVPPATGFPAHCAMRFESSWLGASSISERQDALDLDAVGELAA